MVSPVFIASLLTILPAMGAMWFILSRYEDFFEDARVFMSLVFGFFAGLVTSAFETFAFGFGTAEFSAAAGFVTAAIFFIAGYAFFETGVKAAVLGLKSFRNRKDTPYYGAAFGLGFGAILGMMHIALNLERAGGIHNFTTFSFVTMVALPIGAVFVHGATGVWVAQGVVDGKLWKGWGFAALLLLPMQGAYWLAIPEPGTYSVVLFPSLFAIIYGPTLLTFAQTRVLDHVVPPEVKDKLRREMRRAQRAQDRDKDE